MVYVSSIYINGLDKLWLLLSLSVLIMCLVAILMESVCNWWLSNYGSYCSSFKSGLSVSLPLKQNPTDIVFQNTFPKYILVQAPLWWKRNRIGKSSNLLPTGFRQIRNNMVPEKSLCTNWAESPPWEAMPSQVYAPESYVAIRYGPLTH